jgi:dihydrofolate synthase/folylpolyglutamate synthase
MTYREFLTNLDSRGMFRIRPRLDRIKKVLRSLGNPQDLYPTIHIAGTNGKGSVAAALESVLRASGYQTGLYTSPHLLDLRERVKIDGIPLRRGYTQIADRVRQAENRAKCPLTYFELLTAIAFESFAARRVDIAIVECGLGGLWDATNVIKRPDLSIISSVGLDHTEWLGSNVHQIAAQKAGIIRKEGCIISGVTGPERTTIAQLARKAGSKIVQIGTDFRADLLTTSWRAGKQTIRFLYKGEKGEIVPFGLLGNHQIGNAAVVLAAIKELQKIGWNISTEKRDMGMRDVYWPGRLQLVHPKNTAPILLDGAHNPPAMVQLLRSIEKSPFRNVLKTFVFSAFKDKDIGSLGNSISKVADEVCLCPLPGPRGASLEQLRTSVESVKGPIRTFDSPREALENAILDTPRGGLVVVCGSLALVGQILKLRPFKRVKIPAHV